MLTNPRDALRGQSRSTNTIPYVIQFPLVQNIYSNFVFYKTHHFFDIQLQKMYWPWNLGQRLLKVRVWTRGTIRYIAYDFLLVFISNLSLSFWDRFQKCCDFNENRVRGLSRSLEISPFDRAITTSYWRSVTNYGSISCRFWDIQCRKISWPWNWGQRSLKVIESGTSGRSCMVSYLCSLVTLSLKRTVLEIFDF